MAGLNDEAAFLASTSGQDDLDPQYEQGDEQSDEEEEEEEEDYDPSSAFTPGADTTEVSASEPNVAKSPTPSRAVTASLPASAAPSRTASRMSNQQLPLNSHASQDTTARDARPKTIGGFIEEDDDEEVQPALTAQVAGAQGAVAVESAKSPPTLAPPASLSHTPVPSSVQVNNLPQHTGASDVVPNGTADPVSNPLVPAPSLDGTAASVDGKAAGPAPTQTPVPAPSQSSVPTLAATSLPKARLPHDIVGQLEDRIKEDPKGDLDAWLALVAQYRSKNKLDDARKIYTRLLDVFPSAAEQWIAYAQMEREIDDMGKLEAIFHASLMKVPNVQLWSIYLDHVRRRNPIETDASGQTRQVVSQSYDFVLNQIGNDKDSGQIWQDYISFIKSGPGVAGGTGWQDAQKMDLLRKAYQRAICVPMQAVTTLWKEYDSFEMGLNKMTGRKFLQERSPAYMTARSSVTHLQNITAGLRRGGVPKLQPLPGCQGEDDFNAQVEIWDKWIEWEKEDPLVLNDEDLKAFQQRILYVYKQAVMALRFYPAIWCSAADWCFDTGLATEGNDFLTQGVAANPESCLLAFKRADRVEQTTPAEEGEDGLVRRGDAVREPYQVCLDAMYAMINKLVQREPETIARIENRYAALPPDSREATPEQAEEDGDDNGLIAKPLSRAARKEKEIKDAQLATRAQIAVVSKPLTFVWIALMRAMRRIQGKGKPGEKAGGMRQILTEGRKRGRCTSDIYAASALMEHHCYHDPAATKIFDRGLKLHPTDEVYALAYIKHLISENDITNARAVFETTVSKITAKPDTAHKAKLLYHFFHEWESSYGELTQIANLEKRMVALFPEDPALVLFAQRYRTSTLATPVFDPCTTRLAISPVQARPKTASLPSTSGAPMPTVEAMPPLPAPPSYVQSPKRPLVEDSDAEQPARKLLRGDSPLKGAAGRRQQQQRQQQREQHGSLLAPAPPKPFPPLVSVVLSIIPPARAWTETRFDPAKMVDLVRSADLTRARVGGQPAAAAGQNYGYGYGR